MLADPCSLIPPLPPVRRPRTARLHDRAVRLDEKRVVGRQRRRFRPLAEPQSIEEVPPDEADRQPVVPNVIPALPKVPRLVRAMRVVEPEVVLERRQQRHACENLLLLPLRGVTGVLPRCSLPLAHVPRRERGERTRVVGNRGRKILDRDDRG